MPEKQYTEMTREEILEHVRKDGVRLEPENEGRSVLILNQVLAALSAKRNSGTARP